jgi:hypothetical protein
MNGEKRLRDKLRWTGLFTYKRPKLENEEYVAGKTVWDAAQLLLIPAILLVATFVFNEWQTDRDNARDDTIRKAQAEAADRQAQSDQLLAVDEQRERVLQDYFDEMSGLVLHEGLIQSRPGSDVRVVARTRTLSAVRRLDGERKGSLLQFLVEGHLVNRHHPIVELRGADLSEVTLPFADLRHVSLEEVNLTQANLPWAKLQDSDLTFANASNACLAWSNLDHAILDDAKFAGANLEGVTLNWAGTTKPEYSRKAIRQIQREERLESEKAGVEVKLATPLGVDFQNAFLAMADGRHTQLAAGIYWGAVISGEKGTRFPIAGKDTTFRGASLDDAKFVSEEGALNDPRHVSPDYLLTPDAQIHCPP